MVDGFDLLNQAAQKAEKPAESPAPEAAAPQTCAMCGAMSQHMDPEKLKLLMANNPFAK